MCVCVCRWGCMFDLQPHLHLNFECELFSGSPNIIKAIQLKEDVQGFLTCLARNALCSFLAARFQFHCTVGLLLSFITSSISLCRVWTRPVNVLAVPLFSFLWSLVSVCESERRWEVAATKTLKRDVINWIWKNFSLKKIKMLIAIWPEPLILETLFLKKMN